jgi:hypothetical protein
MVEAAGDLDRVSVTNFVNVFSNLRMTVALGPCEAVMIDLRLGMMVGRIRGPAAGTIDDLARDQVGIGAGCVIE